MKRIPYKTDQNHPAIVAYVDAIEKGRQSFHVWFRDNKWVVERASKDAQASQVFETQAEAAKVAESIARERQVSFFLHGKDGYITERKDFWPDEV